MAQQINDNFKVTAPKLMDDRSHKMVAGVATAYDSVNEALSSIPKAYRAAGLFLLVRQNNSNKLYWFQDGTEDNNLIPFVPPTITQIDQVPTSGNVTYALSSDGAYSFLQGKVDKLQGKDLSSNDYTNSDKTIVGNASVHITDNTNPHNVTKAQVGLANVPNVDATNPANITQTTDFRFVTDTQIATWDTSNGSVTVDQTPTSGNTTHVISSAGAFTALQGKVDKVTGKALSTNDYLNTDKAKVAAIDQAYTAAEKTKLGAIAGTNTGDETTTRINTLYGYTPASASILTAHTSNVSNPHSVTKAQVGLGNVANLDTTNPVNITQDATHRFVTDTQINTWNAGGGGGGGGSSIDDTAIRTTTTYSSSKIENLLVAKVDVTRTINSKVLNADITLTKADIGLGNVLNLDTSNPGNITQSASFRFTTDTEKATWNGKQNLLVSGTSIKTVGGFSMLGSGDIPAASIDDTTSTTTTTYSSSKVVNLLSGKANTVHSHVPADIGTNSTNRFVTDAQITSWTAKQDPLVAGTTIKTINGASPLGSGDLAVGRSVGSATFSTPSLALPAGTFVDKMVVVVSSTITLSIGTTSGGSDLGIYTCDPPYTVLANDLFFVNATTLFFTGMASGNTIKIFKQ